MLTLNYGRKIETWNFLLSYLSSLLHKLVNMILLHLIFFLNLVVQFGHYRTETVDLFISLSFPFFYFFKFSLVSDNMHICSLSLLLSMIEGFRNYFVIINYLSIFFVCNHISFVGCLRKYYTPSFILDYLYH